MKLTINNVSKRYGNGVQALKDVSLEISTGMFGLLGPNGAGKSTLMRTIATLQEADSGSIVLDGIDVLKEKDKIRRILGYLPQEFGVYPESSAEELLSHLAILKGISRTKDRKQTVTTLLKQTNLYQYRKKKLGSYSGGMLQRFGIAQALLGSPELIIVDEPTAGLDPEERKRFHNLLSEIGESVIVILSTHIVDDVSQLCGNMAIIHEGRVLLTGEPIKTMAGLQGKIWRKVIDKQELSQYKDTFNVISTNLFAGKLLLHVHSETRPDNSFEEVEPTLEDVYFTTIKAAKKQELEEKEAA
ncbi:MAG: ABC transporter ATP-binding protein [Candidatus Aminicenantes bacterium]|nr:ABC transporter ATP-binding protein [Candidatus Aminicenantes bacterium]